MAGKNQVTLTFAGDSTSLERSFDRVGSSARQMGDDAQDQERKLDRLGNAGGTAETRFLGLGAGISGVSTIMSGDAGPEDYAMALADLGDSIEHTVVPLIQGMGMKILTTGRNAVVSAAQHAAAAASTVAGWVMMGIQSTINAVKMAAAWLISLGPIGLVIAAIAAIIAILVALGVDFEDVKNAIGAGWEFIKNAALGVFNWVKTNWPLLLAIITGPIGLAVLAISRHWNTIKSGASSLFSSIRNAATGAKDWIVGRFNDVVSFFQGLPGTIASAFSGVGDSIVAGIKSIWNNTVGGFGFTVPSWVPGVGGRGFHIPTLHTGGIFNSGVGEGLALLRDGEGVFTPDQMAAMGGSGAPHVTVNLNVGGSILSERDVVRVIRDEFQRGGFAGVGAR